MNFLICFQFCGDIRHIIIRSVIDPAELYSGNVYDTAESDTFYAMTCNCF